MKKIYILIITAIAASATLLSSCKKVLEKQPQTTLTPAEIFSDSLITVFYLNTIYTNNQPTWAGNSGGAIGSVGPGSLTEENTGGSPYVSGTGVTIETVADIGVANNNSNTYAKIRNINDFLQGMQTSPIAAPIKRRFMAQAYFWRAYRYFELVKIYGGVPIETVPLPVVGPDAKAAANLPRNTTTETFARIKADLDSAINNLPAVWPNSGDYGRITKGAAQAYLGRVLLTYASPQFNRTNDITRWQTALTACNAAISTLSNAGYGLYPKEDVTMWTTEGAGSPGKPANVEAVMVTEFTNTNTSNSSSNGYTASGIPKALGGGGGNNPTWDEVQAFPMADGLPKESASAAYPYNSKLFFDNRDPRFYQTIAYNGCNWPLEGNPLNRLWTYFYYTNATGTTASTTEPTGSSSTGFYCRKAIDPNLSLANLSFSGTDWQEIRYAEVILNRAECAAATGDLTTAFNDLVAIRKRAGIIAGSSNLYGLTSGMSQTAMINAIMYERQIEFAYEGKRYWDLRRRMLLEPTLNGKLRQGLTITLNNTGTKTDYLAINRDALATTSLDNVYLTYFNSATGEVTKNIDTTPINYLPNQYFFGIPTNAIKSNIGLIQNNTWGGPFDPLQ
ncbi:MAG: RagB/SusD family nutrient uptake outer membrane protein [Bacteroidota bacterium]